MTDGGLDDLRFAVAGPGRVGRSLAGWLVARGARWCATGARAAGLESLREPAAEPFDRLLTGDLDLLLLTVPDAVLAGAAEALSVGPQAAVVLHASGRLPGEVLAPLRARGSAVGSLHPLRAFPRPDPDPAAASGLLFAVDGDALAEALARRLVTAWGGRAVAVPATARPLYHLAATLAAGGVGTLVATAARIAAAAGLPAELAEGYLRLARGALAAMPDAAPATALTGPVVRGEAAYLGQLAGLEDLLPTVAPLATVLALATLEAAAGAAGGSTPAQEGLARDLRQRVAAAGFLAPLLADPPAAAGAGDDEHGPGSR